MPDSTDVLLQLRDVGIRQLPQVGDPGDRAVRAALDRQINAKQHPPHRWNSRRIRIGRFAVTPAAALAVVAATATATTAAVTFTATSLFQANPQSAFNNVIGSVLPATVQQVSSVHIPDYGTVQFWAATTQKGGFCFALKLPDGDWGGLNIAQNARDGFDGGSIPGCFQTQQQQIIESPQPALMPNALEIWSNNVTTSAGQHWDIYVGYVEAQGTAATVRDTAAGISVPVDTTGYFLLAAPQTGTINGVPCQGCDVDDLHPYNATGQELAPDYTTGKLLPGYSPGPTPGVDSSSS